MEWECKIEIDSWKLRVKDLQGEVEQLEEELRVYDESLGITGARLAWKAKNDKLREALENTRSVLLAPGYVYIGRAVSIIDETLKGGK